MSDVKDILQQAVSLEAQNLLQYKADEVNLEVNGPTGLACKLHKMSHRARHHMSHLSARLVQLGSTPKLGAEDVSPQGGARAIIEHAETLENNVIDLLQQGVDTAREERDTPSRRLFEKILECHFRQLAWIQAQLKQMAQIGDENYISLWVEAK